MSINPLSRDEAAACRGRDDARDPAYGKHRGPAFAVVIQEVERAERDPDSRVRLAPELGASIRRAVGHRRRPRPPTVRAFLTEIAPGLPAAEAFPMRHTPQEAALSAGAHAHAISIGALGE